MIGFCAVFLSLYFFSAFQLVFANK